MPVICKPTNVVISPLIRYSGTSAFNPVDVARRDLMEFFIKNVISYRGNLKRKTELGFQVKWLGYHETHDSWEPYANLRD